MKPNKPKPTASGSTHHKSRRSVVPNPLLVEAAACATIHSCASSRIKTVDNIADNSASVQHHFQNAAFRGSLKGARGLGERKAVGNHVKYFDAPRSQQIQRRSEEHTSELQSQSNLVCRLLLEKKKNTPNNIAKARWSG